jgi:phenolic acid decarboxylase
MNLFLEFVLNCLVFYIAVLVIISCTTGDTIEAAKESKRRLELYEIETQRARAEIATLRSKIQELDEIINRAP